MVLGMALPLLVQWLDHRRLPLAVRGRSWNTATWGASLYAFGPLSMLGWFWTTRPRWRRVWMGALATGALVGLMQLLDFVGMRALGQAADLSEVMLAFGGAGGAGLLLLGAMELVVAVRRRLH
jgi:hypothetical protein